MRVYVNDHPVDLAPGMKVRHALTAAGFAVRKWPHLTVRDEWGHAVGLDGALAEGVRIFVNQNGEDGSTHG
jgi:hypothetical protein